MIPTSHGEPNDKLTVWCRLWESDRRGYFSCRLDERQKVILQRMGDEYLLQINYLLLCIMKRKLDPLTNEVFLEGEHGMLKIIARVNPSCFNPDISLYIATKTPCQWNWTNREFECQKNNL